MGTKRSKYLTIFMTICFLLVREGSTFRYKRHSASNTEGSEEKVSNTNRDKVSDTLTMNEVISSQSENKTSSWNTESLATVRPNNAQRTANMIDKIINSILKKMDATHVNHNKMERDKISIDTKRSTNVRSTISPLYNEKATKPNYFSRIPLTIQAELSTKKSLQIIQDRTPTPYIQGVRGSVILQVVNGENTSEKNYNMNILGDNSPHGNHINKFSKNRSRSKPVSDNSVAVSLVNQIIGISPMGNIDQSSNRGGISSIPSVNDYQKVPYARDSNYIVKPGLSALKNYQSREKNGLEKKFNPIVPGIGVTGVQHPKVKTNTGEIANEMTPLIYPETKRSSTEALKLTNQLGNKTSKQQYTSEIISQSKTSTSNTETEFVVHTTTPALKHTNVTQFHSKEQNNTKLDNATLLDFHTFNTKMLVNKTLIELLTEAIAKAVGYNLNGTNNMVNKNLLFQKVEEIRTQLIKEMKPYTKRLNETKNSTVTTTQPQETSTHMSVITNVSQKPITMATSFQLIENSKPVKSTGNKNIKITKEQGQEPTVTSQQQTLKGIDKIQTSNTDRRHSKSIAHKNPYPVPKRTMHFAKKTTLIQPTMESLPMNIATFEKAYRYAAPTSNTAVRYRQPYFDNVNDLKIYAVRRHLLKMLKQIDSHFISRGSKRKLFSQPPMVLLEYNAPHIIKRKSVSRKNDSGIDIQGLESGGIYQNGVYIPVIDQARERLPTIKDLFHPAHKPELYINAPDTMMSTKPNMHGNPINSKASKEDAGSRSSHNNMVDTQFLNPGESLHRQQTKEISEKARSDDSGSDQFPVRTPSQEDLNDQLARIGASATSLRKTINQIAASSNPIWQHEKNILSSNLQALLKMSDILLERYSETLSKSPSNDEQKNSNSVVSKVRYGETLTNGALNGVTLAPTRTTGRSNELPISELLSHSTPTTGKEIETSNLSRNEKFIKQTNLYTKPSQSAIHLQHGQKSDLTFKNMQDFTRRDNAFATDVSTSHPKIHIRQSHPYPAVIDTSLKQKSNVKDIIRNNWGNDHSQDDEAWGNILMLDHMNGLFIESPKTNQPMKNLMTNGETQQRIEPQFHQPRDIPSPNNLFWNGDSVSNNIAFFPVRHKGNQNVNTNYRTHSTFNHETHNKIKASFIHPGIRNNILTNFLHSETIGVDSKSSSITHPNAIYFNGLVAYKNKERSIENVDSFNPRHDSLITKAEADMPKNLSANVSKTGIYLLQKPIDLPPSTHIDSNKIRDREAPSILDGNTYSRNGMIKHVLDSLLMNQNLPMSASAMGAIRPVGNIEWYRYLLSL